MNAEEQVVEVDVDLVKSDEIAMSERAERRKKAYVVEVRTRAGFEARFRVHQEKVEKLARQAERQFIRRGELAEGDCRLEKLAGGTSVPLVPSATLKEAGVVAGTVCVLVVADPQVDG
ncbi:hypothetical protein [Amycolatopsis nalaikhensis]|uniref:Uncharacterized protein n=1 Tax=Amycolatopsis nalaikhensis TaxID=715472 RepID=A0ABY8XCB0_9PSEU|nr:hypothetical protein [Amycolatopsis sp. 2-2]WIV52999.1 hypothetical protein QP939_29170 [Amycolatopsis sp. 2-2]